uniref:Uncharacterized protein n=1 Tax=Mustela putorius furo TaxID=9669 RepID=M3XTX9_MUSPF
MGSGDLPGSQMGLAEDLGRPGDSRVSASGASGPGLSPPLPPSPPPPPPLPGALPGPPPTSGIPASRAGACVRRSAGQSVRRGKPSAPACGGCRAWKGKGAEAGPRFPPTLGGAQEAAVLKRRRRRRQHSGEGGREHEWGGACPRAPAPLVPPAQLRSRSRAGGPGVRGAPSPVRSSVTQAYQDAVWSRNQGDWDAPLQQEPSEGRTQDQASSPTGARHRVWDAVGSAEGRLGAAEAAAGWPGPPG